MHELRLEDGRATIHRDRVTGGIWLSSSAARTLQGDGQLKLAWHDGSRRGSIVRFVMPNLVGRTVFTLAGLFGLRAGSICTVSDVVPWHPTDDIINFEENITDCIKVGIGGMKILMGWDDQRGDEKYWRPGL